ncbi:MAG: hypothetical protein WC457_05040, partial [Patescibacteria group bacterium]
MPHWKRAKKLIYLATFLLLLVFGVQKVNAAFNPQINYQGKLLNSSGQRVSDTKYNFRFRLCADSSCTSALWTEDRCYTGATNCNSVSGDNRISVTSSLFSVLLGELTSIASLDFNQTLYLEVQVGGTSTASISWETLLPRKKLGVVPAAFYAATSSYSATSTYAVSASTSLYANNSGLLQGLSWASPGALGTGTATTAIFTNATTTGMLRVIGNSYFGTIASGTWQGTTISNAYGGTGQNSSAWTGLVRVTAGVWSTTTINLASDVTSTLTISHGGTGTSTAPTTGQWLIGNASGGYNYITTSSLGLIGTDLGGFTAGSIIFASSTGKLTQDNSNLYWNDTNNRLGIGTTSPQVGLHLGTAATSHSMVDANDAMIGGELEVNGTLYADVGIQSGGAIYNNLLTSGNSTYGEIHLYRNNLFELGTGSNTNILLIAETSDLYDAFGKTAQSNPTVYIQSGSSTIPSQWLSLAHNRTDAIIGSGYGGFRFSASSTPNALVITETGNIGIGTTTPTYKLTVAGDISVTGTLRVGNSADAGTSGYILMSNGNSTAPAWVSTTTLGLNGTSVGGFTAGSIIFASSTGALTQDNSNFYWDDTNNRLGIGTTAPGYPLEVAKSDGDSAIYVRTENLGSSAVLRLGAKASNGARNLGEIKVVPTGGESGNLVFNLDTDNGGALSEVMRINYNGLVGIGTTTPSEKLVVDGSVNITAGSYYKYNGVNLAYASTTLYNYFFGNAGNLTMTGSNNTVAGHAALRSDTTGSDNSAYGYTALYTNSTGSNNIAIGRAALYSNVSGNNNTAIGMRALQVSTSSNQTAVGAYSLYSNTSGSDNAAFGYQTLYTNTLGGFNTAIGNQTLFANTEGNYNTAIGYSALVDNTTGDYNIALGDGALANNQTADNNIAIGSGALFSNTSTGFLTAIGYNTLYDNTTGAYNTGVGYRVLEDNISGSNNTSLGFYASRKNSTGSHNTAVGYDALMTNTSTSNLTAVGSYALSSNTSGSDNTAMGYQSLYANTTGRRNAGVGAVALQDNVDGEFNAAFGYSAMANATSSNNSVAIGAYSLNGVITSGDEDVAVGAYALTLLTSGSYNVSAGSQSLYSLTSGNDNVALGFRAGRYITGGSTALTTANQSIYLGSLSKAYSDSATNEIVIGYGATGIGSNSVVLGNDSIATTSLKGYVGIGTTTPTYKLTVAGDLSVTGTLRVGNSADAGTSGYILMSNGNSTAPAWVSTTTLGLNGTSVGGFTAGSVIFASSTGALTQDNSNFYWDDTNNRLGIGTTTPGYGLHLSGGNFRSEGTFRTGLSGEPGRWRFYDSSGYLMSFWDSSTDYDTWGLYWDTTDNEYRWMGNGTMRSSIDLDDGSAYFQGNVGIGTTYPSTTLHVNGSIAVNNNGKAIGFRNADASGWAGYFDSDSSNNTMWHYNNGGSIAITALNSNGNVGIGTTTPNYKLDVYQGNMGVHGSVSNAYLESTGRALVFERSSANYLSASTVGGYFDIVVNGAAVSDSSAALKIGADNNISIPNGSLTVSGSGNSSFVGNLGIGTTTPTYKLTVAGDLAVTGTIRVGDSANAGTVGQLLMSNNSTAAPTWVSTSTLGLMGTSLASAYIWVGNASGVATAVAMSSDATISNTGALTIANNSVDGTDIQIGSEATGGMMYYNGTDWTNLAAGTSGYVLRANGAAAPTWAATSSLGILATDVGGLTAGSVVFASSSGKLTQDNSNFYWDDTNNRLGIGTASPAAKLSLNVGGDYTNDMLDILGTGESAQGVEFKIQPAVNYNTSMRDAFRLNAIDVSGSGAELYFATDNVDRIVINNVGNVGIGVTMPNDKLDVSGSMDITAGSYYKYNGVNLAYASTTKNNYFFGNAGNLTMTGGNNTAVGYYALHNNSGGAYNVAMGTNALESTSAGDNNIALGAYALQNSDNSNNNIAIGREAMGENTSGQNNIAIGTMALGFGNSPSANVGIGFNALYSNTAASNTAVGYQAMYSNTSGVGNIANGYQALSDNTTGDYNIANGYMAMGSTTAHNTGSYNIANGYQALSDNTTGDYNIANGRFALYKNTTGESNIASGYRALYFNTIGNNNIANGGYALYSNTIGNYNIGIGYQALRGNTTSDANIGIGYQALYSNLVASNTAVGYQALYSNTTGAGNTSVGYKALSLNTTGGNNTAFGYNALAASESSYFNTAFGGEALSDNTGSRNTAIGYDTLAYMTTGSYNTAVGYHAGYISGLDTESYNTMIGAGAVINEGVEYAVAIGHDAIATIDYQIVLGGASNNVYIGSAAGNGGLFMKTATSSGGYALCHSVNGTTAGWVVDCATAPSSDYMEYYAVDNDVSMGDVVMMSGTYVSTTDGNTIPKLSKASSSYDNQIIGIISDKSQAGDFNSTGGSSIKSTDNPDVLALSGRVRVKVTTDNGPIKKGDKLTSSNRSGYAMKATEEGPTIGIAMDDFTGSATGTVMVFVNLSWNNTLYKGLSVDTNANELKIKTQTLSFTTTTFFNSYVSSSLNNTNAFIFDALNYTTSSDNNYILSLRSNNSPVFSVSANGDIKSTGNIYASSMVLGTSTNPGDLAEKVDINPDETVEAGDVMMVDPSYPDRYQKSNNTYEQTIAGV